jgi:hypothetical protein
MITAGAHIKWANPARPRPFLLELAILNRLRRVKRHWEAVADKLTKAGSRCGCITSTNSEGRPIYVATAERNGKRFIVHADKKLIAFVELESALRLAMRVSRPFPP